MLAQLLNRLACLLGQHAWIEGRHHGIYCSDCSKTRT